MSARACQYRSARSRALRVTDHRRHDDFRLDVGKLRARYGFGVEELEIADHCRTVGAQLRRRTAPNIRNGGAGHMLRT